MESGEREPSASVSAIVLLLAAIVAFSSILAAWPSEPATTGIGVQAGAWHIYTVENTSSATGECWYPGISLALDGQGFPHIAYHSAIPGENLRYASWNGHGFSVETVAPTNSSISGTALVIDGSNAPHIAFFTSAEGNLSTFRLQYASRVLGGWAADFVDPDHFADANATFVTVSMVLDAAGLPHLTYPAQDINRTRYAVLGGTSWTVANLLQPSATGSIALDGAGQPHFAVSPPGGNVVYVPPSGPWSNITGALFGGPRSLALDASDLPTVAFLGQSGTFKPVNVATLNGTDWDVTTVDTASTSGSPVPLALDAAGHPHIAYPSGTAINYHLKYAAWSGTSWGAETVDTGAQVGSDVSLALDANGDPHIGYFDRHKCSIKYATTASLKAPPPALAFAPSELDLGVVAEGATASGTFAVWNSGGGNLTYALAADAPWITGISPANGTSAGEHDNVTVTVSTAGLSAGLHSCNVSITSDGGNGTVAVLVNVTAPPSGSVLFRFTPRTLNLGSRGNWVTARLTPVNASVADINASSLLLNDAVAPAWWNVENGTLMVKFDRAAVEAVLHVGDSVDVKVTGSWRTGGNFEAHDTIRVIDP